MPGAILPSDVGCRKNRRYIPSRRATIILPLGLIASAYGMNVAFPGKEDFSGFIVSLVLMGIVVVVMVMFFRRRKWL